MILHLQRPGLWIIALCCLALLPRGDAWAYDDWSECSACHGSFDSGTYTSLQDGSNWGTNLMDAHTPWVGGNCQACHTSGGFDDVPLNLSADDVFSKSCVGCHGRDEDVNGSCVEDGSGPEQVECGSGAGLRRMHDSQVGAGTCSSCHGGDNTPVGEHVQPNYYSLAASSVKNACDADGTESRFGASGLDNDGDGQRDAADADCLQVVAVNINAGMADAWYNPATDGQGFFVTVFEDAGIVFLAWFTYDVERPPQGVTAILGEPGHRWVTAQGPYQGDTAVLDVSVTSGGVFDSAVPKPDDAVKVGTITIQWTSCENATLSYEIDDVGQGLIELQRIVPDNVALCEALQ